MAGWPGMDGTAYRGATSPRVNSASLRSSHGAVRSGTSRRVCRVLPIARPARLSCRGLWRVVMNSRCGNRHEASWAIGALNARPFRAIIF